VIGPRVLWVDERAGVLGMERVEGWSVREVLGGGAEGEDEDEGKEEEEEGGDAEQGEQGYDTVRGVEEMELCDDDEREEESEGMKALQQIGITRGMLGLRS